MKKLLILFLSLSLFTACSDDDDNTENEEQIVGTWVLVDSNNIPNFSVDECTGQSTLTFNSDNTASSNFFANVDGTCQSTRDNGEWSSSNSQYTIEVPGFDQPVTGTVSFNNDRFTFNPLVSPSSSLTFEKV